MSETPQSSGLRRRRNIVVRPSLLCLSEHYSRDPPRPDKIPLQDSSLGPFYPKPFVLTFLKVNRGRIFSHPSD